MKENTIWLPRTGAWRCCASTGILASWTLVATLALGWVGDRVRAGESPEDEAVETIEIVVPARILDQPLYAPFRREGTVRESSRPAYVVDREEMEAQGARTVQEALKYIPGLQTDGTAGGQLGAVSAQFSRGTRSAQVLILLDGRPINDFNGGSFDLSNLTTNAIDRIEYVPGGGSTLYGSNAVGGTINIVTRQPSEAFEVETELGFGSFGYDRQVARISGGDAEIGYAIGYERTQSDSDFPFELDSIDLDGDRENADVLYDNFDAKLRANLGDRTTLTLSALHLNKDFGVAGGIPIPGSPVAGFNALTNDDAQLSNELLADVTLESRLGAGEESVLSVKLYADRLLSENRFSNFLDERQRSQFERDAFGVQATHSWQLAANQNLTYGGDFRRTTATSETFTFATGETEENYDEALSQGALFALYQVNFSPDFSVNVGVRQDFNNLDDSSPTSPSAGARLALSNSTVLRANYAESFRTPTAVDLFFPGFGNPDLEPERGQSFDVGIDQSLGDFGLLRLTFFINQVEEAIVFDFDSSLPQNIGEVETEGLEASLNFRVFRNVYLFANYTLNQSEITENPDASVIGNELNFTDADSFNAGIALETPRGIYIGLLVHSIGDRFTDLLNTEELPSYTTVDLKLRWPVSPDVTVSASLDNIFDERYEVFPGFPGISRNFRVGVKTNW